MNDLPRIEVPGLAFAAAPLVQDIEISLTFPDTRIRLEPYATAAGGVCCHVKGEPQAAHLRPGGVETELLPVDASGVGWRGIDVFGDRIAVATGTALSIFDSQGELIRGHELSVDSGSCRYAPTGQLWHLAGHGGGTATLRLLDQSGEVADEKALTFEKEWRPAYWLDDPHPARATVPVSAGMGQDGVFHIFAHARGDEIALDDPVEHICFAGWGESDEEHLSLPHYGGELSVHSLGAEDVRMRDLSPLLLELDDGHDWHAISLGRGKYLVPTSEGRLLCVPIDGDGDVLDLRLEGDERNLDWFYVGLGSASSLVTYRSGDRSFKVWDLSDLA